MYFSGQGFVSHTTIVKKADKTGGILLVTVK